MIGGPVAAVSAAMEAAQARGAVGAIALSVGGAFHSSLMRTAAEGLSREIETVAVKNASIPVVANCIASPITGTLLRSQ